MWHKVAPRLAQRFTVVAPDLRGYGASSKPPTDEEHLPYSKRAMARDLVEVMAALGFKQFDIAGHDRGGRVTYRLALDHPERVRRAAVLDIIPTLEQFERMNRYSARAAYHWYFLAQPSPFPETLIGKDPDYYLDHSLGSWRGTPGVTCCWPHHSSGCSRCLPSPDCSISSPSIPAWKRPSASPGPGGAWPRRWPVLSSLPPYDFGRVLHRGVARRPSPAARQNFRRPWYMLKTASPAAGRPEIRRWARGHDRRAWPERGWWQ